MAFPPFTFDPSANFAIANLDSGISAVATSMTLASGKGALFPQPSSAGSFNGAIYNSTDYTRPDLDPNVEIVRCTARSTDTLTITRAQEGTSASAHNTAGKTYTFYLPLTKKVYDDLVSAITAASYSVTYSVAQTGHGFSVGDNIKATSTANVYAKAQADSAANAAVVGRVIIVTDANNFIYITEGVFTLGVPAATAGTVYYLDPSSAGASTSTEPTTAGQISKPLFTVIESGAKAYFNNQRGIAVASSSSGITQIYGMVTNTDIKNTTTETSIVSDTNASGSRTLSANSATRGKAYRIKFGGTIDTTGSPTIRLNIYVGSVKVLVTGPDPISVSGNFSYHFDGVLICTATGASGTFKGSGLLAFGDYVAQIDLRGAGMVLSSTTVDTTVSQTIDVKVQWSTANNSNTFKTNYMTIDS